MPIHDTVLVLEVERMLKRFLYLIFFEEKKVNIFAKKIESLFLKVATKSPLNKDFEKAQFNIVLAKATKWNKDIERAFEINIQMKSARRSGQINLNGTGPIQF